MARFETWPPQDLDTDDLYGTLLFADGSQKVLAAFTVWVALILCWKKHDEDCLGSELVQSLICSLMWIPASVRASEVRGSQLDATIQRIVSQNSNAKVQPITSFGWAGILRGLLGESASFDECLQAYNRHPEVVAHDRAESGTGSISLDSRKRQAVKNFLDRCDAGAFDVVASSCHDIPFSSGPFGEAFACTNACFMGSKVLLEPITGTDDVNGPLANEAFVEAGPSCANTFLKINVSRFDVGVGTLFSMFQAFVFLIQTVSNLQVDWTLPMNGVAQQVFFQKVRALFSRATVGVALNAKKKYRLSSDELVKVRNLSVLFAQVWPHLQAHLPSIEATQWELGFVEGTAYDDDFYALLDSRPAKVPLSMLKSQKEAARKKEQEKQQLICSEVAEQRNAVQEAQWKFFCSALRQDQGKLLQVQVRPCKPRKRWPRWTKAACN